MAIKNWSIIKNLTSQYTGENYCSLLKGTGREFVVNFILTSEVINPAVPAFSPPPPPGLQYEADRQAQIRAYAESLPHYELQLWERTIDGTFFRKNFPIYKYFPDHQLDIYPLLWSTTEAGIGNKELLLKFKDGTLPTAEDKISVSLDYYTSQVDEIWFSLEVPANTEISFQLPDNYMGYSFKQRLGTEPLRWALSQGVVLSSIGYDTLDASFEEIRDDVIDQKIFFACEVSTVVLLKVWS